MKQTIRKVSSCFACVIKWMCRISEEIYVYSSIGIESEFAANSLLEMLMKNEDISRHGHGQCMHFACRSIWNVFFSSSNAMHFVYPTSIYKHVWMNFLFLILLPCRCHTNLSFFCMPTRILMIQCLIGRSLRKEQSFGTQPFWEIIIQTLYLNWKINGRSDAFRCYVHQIK